MRAVLGRTGGESLQGIQRGHRRALTLLQETAAEVVPELGAVLGDREGAHGGSQGVALVEGDERVVVDDGEQLGACPREQAGDVGLVDGERLRHGPVAEALAVDQEERHAVLERQAR